MTEVSDYDFFDYDYSNYWKARKYEDLAEKSVLKKIFKGKKGEYIVDIGGSYGRLLPVYYKHYEHPIILDYSLNTLQKNSPILKKKYPKVTLIAGNAYHMPFKDESFDAGLMVRVLHHIADPEQYFKELSRITHNKSIYIQEFANKINIKASVRAILHLNFDFFRTTPYQQPTKNNFEGTKRGEEALFLNFHPEYVKQLLQKNGFLLEAKYGCSYIRSAFLKKVIGQNNMVKIENVLQKIFKSTNIPPSIFFETKKISKNKTDIKEHQQLEKVLVCPDCHSDLRFKKGVAECTFCKRRYLKKNNIWDFRI